MTTDPPTPTKVPFYVYRKGIQTGLWEIGYQGLAGFIPLALCVSEEEAAATAFQLNECKSPTMPEMARNPAHFEP